MGIEAAHLQNAARSIQCRNVICCLIDEFFGDKHPESLGAQFYEPTQTLLPVLRQVIAIEELWRRLGWGFGHQ